MSAGRPGEAALIARYFAPLAGPGADALRDDAAVLTANPGHDLVVTVDAIVAGIHYFPDDPPGSIARKALGVNLSDLAAKGAAPRGFLLTLALADDWTEEWLGGFADGLARASAEHACPLLGGDTVRTAGPPVISVTAFGEVPAGTMVRRRGARPGDRLYVSGEIGDAALGLALRTAPTGALATALTEADRDFLLDRYLHPRPRLALARALRAHARAAMDVSDGLAGDLAKMLDDGVTGRVNVAAVPLSSAVRCGVSSDADALVMALTGGDDYELLCAVPPDTCDAFANAARAAGVPVAEIGAIVEGSGPPLFTMPDGSSRTFANGAFSHF